MDNKQLNDLKTTLNSMSLYFKNGKALVESLQSGITVSQDPKLKEALNEALQGWLGNQNIIPPFEKHQDIFPRTVYSLTQAGFYSGLLEKEWGNAVKILDDLLEYNNSHKDPNQRQAIFYTQLDMLTGAGVPILIALNNISDDIADPELTKVIAEMTSAVKQGQLISTVILKHPEIFDPTTSMKFIQAEQNHAEFPTESTNNQSGKV